MKEKWKKFIVKWKQWWREYNDMWAEIDKQNRDNGYW